MKIEKKKKGVTKKKMKEKERNKLFYQAGTCVSII